MAIKRLLYQLQKKFTSEVVIHTGPTWSVPKISATSTLGEQIKYYRRLAGIKQRDLALRLGYERGVIDSLENDEIKMVNVNLIRDVIKELDIEDKVVINDDYIAFVLNEPDQQLLEFRRKNHLTRVELSRMMGTHISVIKKWERGQSIMTRTSYNKLKKCMG